MGGPPKGRFQVTHKAACDSMLITERIALLCWERMMAGDSKDQALRYRGELLEKVHSVFGKPKSNTGLKRKTTDVEEPMEEPEPKKKGKRDKAADKAVGKPDKVVGGAKRDKVKGK